MRGSLKLLSLLLVAFAANAADPLYLDQMMETQLPALQSMFPDLKKEGCYQIGENRYLLVTIEKKDQKPWRIVLASTPPCKHAEIGPQLDIRERAGAELGQTQLQVIQKMGRPETALPSDPDMKKFGDMEYFYVCRVSDGCARHTSVFMKGGTVSAIAEWYSQ